MSATKSPLRTILVVEDEEMVRQMVAMILEDAGFRVLQASSFDEAEPIWLAEKNSIDLLLTDSRLPGVSGPEMAQEFKRDKPALRIIISSGDHDLTSANLVDLVTEDDLLTKPYTPKKLLDAVGKRLE